MKIDGLILAAGFSRRAGTHKMVLEIGGKTVLGRCIEAMTHVCGRIIVVGGYGIENIAPICKKYSQVRLIYNEDYPSGMFSSVKAGLIYIENGKFFIIPGDYPLVQSYTYQAMKAAEGEVIIPRFRGMRGHPVLLESACIQEILFHGKYICLRDFINGKAITTVEVADPGILMDMDTPSDYEKILQFFHENKGPVI